MSTDSWRSSNKELTLQLIVWHSFHRHISMLLSTIIDSRERRRKCCWQSTAKVLNVIYLYAMYARYDLV